LSLIKLEIPPGMLQVGTDYQGVGRWVSGNLVRFELDGEVWCVRPQGGWAARLSSALTGKCRCIWEWVDNDTVRYVAFGTHSKLYVATPSATTASDITPAGFTAGAADATAAGGYGAGDYGEGTYGTPRLDVAAVQPASMWSMDNFGEVWVGCMAEDANVYSWDPNSGTGTPAAAISGAPTGTAIVVTEDGSLFVLGADGDHRGVAWCDRNALTTWTATATNLAGDVTLQTPGKLMCGRRIRGGTLLWTDQDVHLATYVGLPDVYAFQPVGENCGIASRGAAISVANRAFWMGHNRFYAFDGFTSEMSCDVADGVFGDFNTTQRSKVVAYHEPQFGEVGWLYPSNASTECDRKVVYNYLGNFWYVDEDFARTAAFARGIYTNPIMVDSSGNVYDHETGYSYGGDTPIVRSGPYELGEGERILRARKLIADEKTAGDVRVSFKVRDWPNDSETTYGPYTIDNPVSVRFAGRQARMVVEGVAAAPWRWGAPRVDVVEGSRRY
jgi:hypothetical protein